MGFIIVLILSTLSIAGSAAFFSVYGLARVFSGSFLPIVIMASSLEGGKLVAASFLYRYWMKLTRTMKTYLVSAVIILMLITSMGIFGYLSSAYQDNVLPFEQHNQQIALLEQDKSEAEKLKTERMARQEEINKQIANLPNNFVNGRSRLINLNKPELEQITKDIATYTKQIRDDATKISQLKGQTLQETAHVGPIIFMAKAFGMDVNQATKWLIMLIIFAFDPLAVMLTIGTNIALTEYKKEKKMSTVTATTGNPFTLGKVELSDPPVYSQDKRFQQSKDGLLWVNVAPDAAAAAYVGETKTFTVNNVAPNQTAAAVQTPVKILEVNTERPSGIVQAAIEVLTKKNLTPQEKRMKEELETLLKRHQEVLAANETRAKS